MEEAIRMLGSENHLVRLDGLTRLRSVDAEGKSEHIITAMRDPHRAVRGVAYAMAALYPGDPSLLSALHAAASGAPPVERALALSSLAQAGDASVLPLLVDTLRAKDRLHHLPALMGLCDLGGTEAMAALSEHVAGRTPPYWSLLAIAVAAAGPEGLETLASLAVDPRQPELTRAWALKALSDDDVDSAVSAAARCVEAEDPNIRATVRTILTEAPAEAAPFVLEGLADAARRDGLIRIMGHGIADAPEEYAAAMGAIRDADARLAIAEALLEVRDPSYYVAEVLARWCSPRSPSAVRVAAIRAHCWMAAGPRQAVPLLASCLRDSDAEVVRVAREHATGSVLTTRRGDEAKVARELARDHDPARRRLGARWLPWTGPGCVSDLIRLLRDTDADVRAQSALCLAALGGDAARAVPDLIDALDEPLSEIPGPAQIALQEIGEPAIAALMPKATSRDRGAFQAACVLDALNYVQDLERLPTESVADRLMHGDEALRGGAALELGSREDDEAAEALASALMGDPSRVVRSAAAEALGMQGDARAAEALAHALGESFMGVGPEVVQALLEIGDAAAPAVLKALERGTAVLGVCDLAESEPGFWGPLLVAELGGDHSDAHLANIIECVRMLEAAPAGAAAACEAIARSTRGASVRTEAAAAFEATEDDPDRVFSLYLDLARDAEPGVRLAALQWLDAPEVADAAREAAASGPTSLRASALSALRALDQIEGLAEMGREALAEPGAADDWAALEQVMRALGETDVLVEAAEGGWLDSADPSVRERVVSSLDDCGGGALPALRKALADPDPRVFARAANGLRNLGCGDETVGPLVRRLEERGPGCLAAISELVWLGPVALDALRPILAGNDAAMIQTAASVVRDMAEIGVVGASPSVLHSLEAPDRDVRLLALRQCRERW